MSRKKLRSKVSHRRGDTGAVELATKIRLENGNEHRREKKKAMTAVRSKRKLLLRWKQETGEKEIGAIFLASNKKWRIKNLRLHPRGQ